MFSSGNKNSFFPNGMNVTTNPLYPSIGTTNPLGDYSLQQANNPLLPPDMRRAYAQQFVNNTQFKNSNDLLAAQAAINNDQHQAFLNLGKKGP